MMLTPLGGLTGHSMMIRSKHGGLDFNPLFRNTGRMPRVGVKEQSFDAQVCPQRRLYGARETICKPTEAKTAEILAQSLQRTASFLPI